MPTHGDPGRAAPRRWQPEAVDREARGVRAVDYEREGLAFHATRGRTTDTAGYEAPIRREMADAPAGCLLDVGSGTGAWSTVLAGWTQRTVVAIEPAAGMRAVATSPPGDTGDDGTVPDGTVPDGTLPNDTRPDGTRPDGTDSGSARAVGTGRFPVRVVAARAGELPVRDDAGGAAWLSTVIHHVGDLDVCARELRRALAPGAPVLIRSAFPGRYETIPVVRYFPGSRRALDRLPSVEAVRDTFGRAGFGFVGIERVPERLIDLATWRSALPRQRHADTALVDLTDDEFAAGLRTLDEAIAAGHRPEQVALDLIVLR